MRDCPNGDLRDQLPGYVHGRLASEVTAAVETHLAACEECRREVALLRAVRGAYDAEPVTVDASRVAAAVVAATRRPAVVGDLADAPIVPIRPARARWLRAAAVLVVVGGVSLSVVQRTFGPERASEGAVAGPTTTELAFAGDVADLNDDELAELAAAVASLEAEPIGDGESATADWSVNGRTTEDR